MNKDYTHVAMIVDRSGSMSSCWQDVKGGYSELVRENKETPGKCTFTVVAFDDEYDVVEDFTDIQAVKETLTVYPRGSTALLDAIGRTIKSVGARLAEMKEEERPMKVVICVFTDGEENSSKEFTLENVKCLINEHIDVYKWQFQFIGATLETVKNAEKWGFRNTTTYNTANTGETYKLYGEKLSTMRSATTYDAFVKASCFTDAEKVKLNALI